MNMVSRTVCRSLAKTIVDVEKEIGTELDPKQMVHYLNDTYKLVKPENTKSLEVITHQVALEVPAERFAAQNSLPANSINPIGMGMIVIDREAGKLKRDVEGEMVNAEVKD